MTRRWTVAEERFEVTYDGGDIESGRIDARELGMSLVGLADLLKAVQATQPELAKELPVSLEARATEPGSFIIDLILVGVGATWDYVRQVFTGTDVTAIVNLTALLGTSQLVLRWIAKHGIPEIARHEQVDADNVRIWQSDGTVIEMPSDVFLAIRSEAVLNAAELAVRPLEHDGIDTMRISSDSTIERSVTIEKADLPRFERPEVEPAPVDDSEVEETWVNFLGVSFDGGGKYRIYDGEREYAASLDDAEFLEAVISGRVAFRADDEVEVVLRHEPYRTRKQVRVRHSIERVRTLRRHGDPRAIWDETRDRKHG